MLAAEAVVVAEPERRIPSQVFRQDSIRDLQRRARHPTHPRARRTSLVQAAAVVAVGPEEAVAAELARVVPVGHRPIRPVGGQRQIRLVAERWHPIRRPVVEGQAVQAAAGVGEGAAAEVVAEAAGPEVGAALVARWLVAGICQPAWLPRASIVSCSKWAALE